MRMDMIDVLQAVGGQKAVAALLKQMQDSNSSTNVRQKSARALGEFNQPEVVSQLVIVFGKKSSDPYLRKAAGESLVQLGSRDAIEPAMQILKEENSPEVIPVAIQIVAMSNDPRAVALIKKVWRQHRDDDSIRAAAEVALAQM
jgi:HEAT repeat protein